jgi:hypothetical protein
MRAALSVINRLSSPIAIKRNNVLQEWISQYSTAWVEFEIDMEALTLSNVVRLNARGLLK